MLAHCAVLPSEVWLDSPRFLCVSCGVLHGVVVSVFGFRFSGFPSLPFPSPLTLSLHDTYLKEGRSASNMVAKSWGGWAAVLGSNYEAIALYRISLGIMLLIELVSRFQYLHPFYSDEG